MLFRAISSDWMRPARTGWATLMPASAFPARPEIRSAGRQPRARNVISANGNWLRHLFHWRGHDGQSVQGNYIGSGRTGNNALRQFFDGINLQNVTSNQIGGSMAGAGNLISSQWFRQHRDDGIYLANSAWTVIQGNFIGTDLSGTRARGNVNYGIYMQGSSTNQIGGTVTGARNLISANDLGWHLSHQCLMECHSRKFRRHKGGRHQRTGQYSSQCRIRRQWPTNNTVGGTAAGSGNVLAFAQTYNGFGYSGVRVRNGASTI